tara:strand:- start:525 stop:779 length:255 start_codon:yes stop_codon:yes gene_type:complete
LHASNLFYYRDIAASMLSMMRHPRDEASSSTDADTSPNAAPELRRSAKARRGTHDGGRRLLCSGYALSMEAAKKNGEKILVVRI